MDLETPLIGHESARRAVFESWASGRLHHAWLLYGPQGIGKARFAAQMAGFLVSEPDPSASPGALSFDPSGKAIRLMEQGAHPDVKWIDRKAGQTTKKVPKSIPVAEVRKGLQHMQATAGHDGWRVCVIDALDDLNREGANALLKPLEEPNQRMVLVLVAHRLSAVLPTIRSRCRLLRLSPLGPREMEQFAAADVAEDHLALLIRLSDGRPGQLRALMEEPSLLSAYQQFCVLAATAASPDLVSHPGRVAQQMELSQNIARFELSHRLVFLALVEEWMARRLRDSKEPVGIESPTGNLTLAAKAGLASLWSDHAERLIQRQVLNIDVTECFMVLFAQLDQVYSAP